MLDDELRERDARRRQQAEDLADVARSPAGRRVLLRMLRRWGAGRPVGGTEAELALRNEAEMLLSDLMQAAPQAGMEFLTELYGGYDGRKRDDRRDDGLVGN